VRGNSAMRGPDRRSTGLARSLRRRSTRAELVLWLELRDRRLAGYKFARQQPIGSYIVDFICREHRLVIEVDGGQHADNAADKIRDHALGSEGYRVIRFWNDDVIGNTAGVVQTIKAELESASHPAPLPACGALHKNSSFRGAAQRRTRNPYSRGLCLWIPGSRPSAAPRNDSRFCAKPRLRGKGTRLNRLSQRPKAASV
jgi:very-short-patch-repair endonuclease